MFLSSHLSMTRPQLTKQKSKMTHIHNTPRLVYLLLAVSAAISFQFSHNLQHSVSSARSNEIMMFARPKSKWDLLDDEEDETDGEGSNAIEVPPDMTYIESNIKRQMATYDKLYEIGGQDIINDVYVRAEGEKEWWLVGKVARVSDVTTEQAIERQWPLIERHIWALRLPIRPLSNLSNPFEVWYAPGNTEYDAVRNDPKIKFTKCSGVISYGGSEVKKELVGFVGKVYMGGNDDPMIYVERNMDGTVLENQYCEGDWVLKSDLSDRPSAA